METSAPILVTGATGFVGSHFAYRALGAGRSIVALVRGAKEDDARARLRRTLADVAASYDESPLAADAEARLQVVLGDVTRPACGLDADALNAWRGRIATFWHFAASLAYEETAADEIARHNVGGVKNALACGRALAAGRFMYVSTAYTAGRRSGHIPEEMHPNDTVFNNHYERTKAEAERTVLAELSLAGTDVRILRPSIVIGPSQTHVMGGSGTGVYGLLRELRRGRRALNAGSAVHRVAGDPDVEVNVIPVDHVVDAMLRFEEGECPAGRIFHLTNPRGPRLGDALTLGCELVGVRPIELVPGHEPTSTVEKMLRKRFEFYSYYFRDPKSFARSLPSELALSSVSALRPYVERALARGASPA